jgi:hypothetical protein
MSADDTASLTQAASSSSFDDKVGVEMIPVDMIAPSSSSFPLQVKSSSSLFGSSSSNSHHQKPPQQQQHAPIKPAVLKQVAMFEKFGK